MNSSSSTSIASALALLALVAAPLPARAQQTTEAELEAAADQVEAAADAAEQAATMAEATVFMEAYADDLRSGNRAAIAGRYDRAGAWRQGNGDHVLEPWPAIEAHYVGPSWSRPFAFEWRDLIYEPSGPDAVVVAGTFLWTARQGQAPLLFSYTSLLVRRDGELRIRLEHESRRP